MASEAKEALYGGAGQVGYAALVEVEQSRGDGVLAVQVGRRTSGGSSLFTVTGTPAAASSRIGC